MQTVTDEYIAAMRLGSRTDRITGTIALTDGTVIDVTDEILVNGNLSIDERCMNSFDIGTFYTNQMKLAIYDSEALLHEFANARVELRYGLLVGEEYEEVFLGKYTVDGTNCKRVRDRVYLTAYDRSAKFDRIKCGQIVNTAMPPYNALQLICSECSVTLATAQEEIEAMPNGTLSIKCDSSRIETMRDCVMWIAALLGGYARINREGMLEIRKAKYSVDPDDQTTIIIDRVLNSKERISTTFSDTRIYPKFMEAYCGGESRVYSSSYVSTDAQARAGSFSLPENPLVISLSAEKQDEINGNILDFLDNFKQRNIKATIFGDPAIECGDTVKCTGGSIDVGRNIVGVITRYTWKFRQQSTIQCVAPAEGEITAESDVSAFSVEAASEETAEGAFVMPRAQSEKKSSGSSSIINLSEKLASFLANEDGSYTINEVTYKPFFNSDSKIFAIADSEGNAIATDPTYADINSNVEFNTLFLTLASSFGIKDKQSGDCSIYEFDFKTTKDLYLPVRKMSNISCSGCIVWGDGTFDYFDPSSVETWHLYAKPGKYFVKIIAPIKNLLPWMSIGEHYTTRSCLVGATLADNIESLEYSESGRGVFTACNIEYLNLGSKINYIGQYTFSACPNLKSFASPKDVTITFGKSATGYSNMFASIHTPMDIILYSVLEIPSYFCNGFIEPVTVFIGNSLTSISTKAFESGYDLIINYQGSEDEWNAINKAADWYHEVQNVTINFNQIF